MIGNYPWIYLNCVNGNTVKEKYKSEHGWVIGIVSIKGEISWSNPEEIFKIIKKYE